MAGLDYRDYLNDELNHRRARNPAYSMRAFARDLGLSPSRLNDVLKGRYGLSSVAAVQIATRLGLKGIEAERFAHLVSARHARLKNSKLEALDWLKSDAEERNLELDHFKLIADWYHLALVELIRTDSPPTKADACARLLGISGEEAREGLARLERLGLLKKSANGWHPVESYVRVNSVPVPSRHVRRFHAQLLAKAEAAIEGRATEERLLNALTLAVDPRKIARAQKLIDDFKKKFNAEMCKGTDITDVYALTIQFFPVTQKGNP